MGITLTKEESKKRLNLRKEEVHKICLTKEPLKSHIARVAFVIDDSGSMAYLYNEGIVQAIMERIFPIALQFDDNGEMEVWAFSDKVKQYPNIDESNYYGYIDKYMNHMFSGTYYAPALKDVYRHYMIEEPAKLPNYVIFITDGDNMDKEETTKFLTAMSKYPIFIQFVGIGNDRFSYLNELDEMDGRYVDNANFFAMNDFLDWTDKELYSKLLAEYPQWLEYPEVKKMLESDCKGPSDILEEKTKKGFFAKLFGL